MADPTLEDEVKFCLRCGTPLVRQACFGRVRPACLQCGWIFFSDPKVAAATLVVRSGKVLLARRANDPRRGLWTLPAGFVDAGEDPAEAAIRECREETGLLVQVERLLEVLYGQEHPRGAHIMIFYQARIVSGGLQPGDDVDQVAFFDVTDLPEMAFSTTARLLQRWQSNGI